MDTEAEIALKFWKALKSDRVTMLALAGVEDGHSQPMSAQLLEEDEERGGPIWFFTAKDTDLAREAGTSHRAQMHFSSKGHDLFAAVHGTLSAVDDAAMVDRLWNPFIAAMCRRSPAEGDNSHCRCPYAGALRHLRRTSATLSR